MLDIKARVVGLETDIHLSSEWAMVTVRAMHIGHRPPIFSLDIPIAIDEANKLKLGDELRLTLAPVE